MALSRLWKRRPVTGRRAPRTAGRRAALPLRFEQLEDRVLLAGSLSINNVTVPGALLGQAVAGTLSPGEEAADYRFAGQAGQRVEFDWLGDAATNSWAVYGPGAVAVAVGGSHAFGENFQVTLPADSSYNLVLSGDQSAAVTYRFRAADDSDAEVAAANFGAVQSGTLAAGGSASFTYTASAGRLAYFDSEQSSLLVWSLKRVWSAVILPGLAW